MPAHQNNSNARVNNSKDSGLPYPQLTYEEFSKFRDEYRRQYGFQLLYADPAGNLIYGVPECNIFPCQEDCRQCRKIMLDQLMVDGCSKPYSCHGDHFLWAVPVMLNQRVCGVLIAVGGVLGGGRDGSDQRDQLRIFEEACQGLLELATAYNLTNRAQMESRRADDRTGALPSTAIRAGLDLSLIQPRLQEMDKQLKHALQRGRAVGVRNALARIGDLLALLESKDTALIRGYVSYLLSTNCLILQYEPNQLASVMRTCGECLTDIASIEGVQAMLDRLEETFMGLLDLTTNSHSNDDAELLNRVLTYIERSFDQHLTRRSVAKACGLSEGRISHLINLKTGRSFSDIVNQYRVDRAAYLLLNTSKPIMDIAMETGFSDQSYFGRIFREHYQSTPVRFRESGKAEVNSLVDDRFRNTI